MTAGRGVPDRVTLAAFGGAVVIGGVNFVAVRYSNRELDPLFGAGIRFAAAALVLLGFMALRRIGFPRGRALGAAVAYGLLGFTISYALAYWALQDLSAGVAAVVFGAMPLITILLAALHGLERITRARLAGALLAVLGIGILANPLSGARLPLLPLLAMVGASVAAAESSVIVKIVPPGNRVATNATAMSLGALVLLVVAAISGESAAIPDEGTTWIALVYLVLIGSVGLFALFLFTLGRWVVTAVAYMTALFPVVAMIAGYLIAGEAITANGVVGGVVVLAGVYIGVLRTGGYDPAAPHETPVKQIGSSDQIVTSNEVVAPGARPSG